MADLKCPCASSVKADDDDDDDDHHHRHQQQSKLNQTNYAAATTHSFFLCDTLASTKATTTLLEKISLSIKRIFLQSIVICTQILYLYQSLTIVLYIFNGSM